MIYGPIATWSARSAAVSRGTYILSVFRDRSLQDLILCTAQQKSPMWYTMCELTSVTPDTTFDDDSDLSYC